VFIFLIFIFYTVPMLQSNSSLSALNIFIHNYRNIYTLYNIYVKLKQYNKPISSSLSKSIFDLNPIITTIRRDKTTGKAKARKIMTETPILATK
jgi:hypothetical protein